MASTPYGRALRGLPNPGVSGLPADAMPANRLPFIQNMRSYQPGSLQPRFGLTYATASVFGGGVHSLARLNDPTAFSTIKALRIAGVAADLNGADIALGSAVAGFTLLDTGYSGDPLTIVAAAPPQSPRPYAYVVDRSRMRKFNSDKTRYPIGLAPPTLPPAITMPRPSVQVLTEANAAADFASIVGSASTGAVGSISRINTTIAAILYDSGATGWCSINPTSMANVQAGVRIGLAGAETEQIQEVIPAVSNTSIAGIVYDIGTTGLCWIQPLSSLGTGILDQIPVIAYTDRVTGQAVTYQEVPNVPVDTADSGGNTPRTRVVDFPVNGLITLGGAAETVRIQAVAIGPDGVQAIRCSTANTHAGGDNITGVSCFRVYTSGTRAAGNAITADGLEIQMTGTLPVGAGSVQMVGGLKSSVVGTGTLAVIDSSGSSGDPRATAADDILVLSIKVDHLTTIDSVRLYMDCDAAGAAAGTVFLQNYFLAEWRANDIIAAIQATNAAITSTITDARITVVTNDQVDPAPGAPSAESQGQGPDVQNPS